MDISGNGASRGVERFVHGSDGKTYYTDTDYGQQGSPAFVEVEQ